ncbi:hypothetical protein [Actinacidiphila oryziradicis]|uniref:Uncharacterized protein n=1 Tax=Actinacidiphila oryziradicis TaxID=2571141 RepID=A0A4U0RJF9_9ACTN|nr:hypothetical protein [Actinacidiphila oryziradicis]TJZ95851.1 hypothetical protein FCI23_51740 [Actinacidiphila oryziradicis]
MDDTDAEAFDFPADLLQLQRELDEARGELARWSPAFSRRGGDEQRVIDMLWARQSQLSAAVAPSTRTSRAGRVKAYLALQRASRTLVMSARPAASPDGVAVTRPA